MAIDSLAIAVVAKAIIVALFAGFTILAVVRSSRNGLAFVPGSAVFLCFLAFVLGRAENTTFWPRFIAALAAVLVVTAILLAGTMQAANAERRRLAGASDAGIRGVSAKAVPIWAIPLVITLLLSASLAIAFVSS